MTARATSTLDVIEACTTGLGTESGGTGGGLCFPKPVKLGSVEQEQGLVLLWRGGFRKETTQEADCSPQRSNSLRVCPELGSFPAQFLSV